MTSKCVLFVTHQLVFYTSVLNAIHISQMLSNELIKLHDDYVDTWTEELIIISSRNCYVFYKLMLKLIQQ